MRTIKYFFVSVVLAALSIANIATGQILAWQFNGSDGKATTYTSTTTDLNLEASIITRGAGAPASGGSTNSMVGALTISANKSEAIANNAYYEFLVKPKAGYYVSLTDIDCSIRIQTYSAKTYQYRYSLDGVNFTDIGNPLTLTDENNNGTFQPTIDLASYPELKNVSSTQTITIRLYAWGGSTPVAGSETLINFGFGKSATVDVPTLFLNGVVSNAPTVVSTNAKIAGWEFSLYNTANPTPATINAGLNNTNLNASVLSRGAGLTAGTYNFAYVSTTSVTTAKATAITNNEYYQLAVSPKSGYKVSLSTLKYRFRCVSSGPVNYRWLYSIDGGTGFTEIGTADGVSTVSSGGVEYQLDLSGISDLQNVKQTVLLRMVVWGATANTAVFGFGRILSGSSTGAPINSIYVRGIVDESTSTAVLSNQIDNDITVIPNKDGKSLILNANISDNQYFKLQIIGADGKTLLCKALQLSAGNNSVLLSSELRSGLYIARLTDNNNKTQSFKFIHSSNF